MGIVDYRSFFAVTNTNQNFHTAIKGSLNKKPFHPPSGKISFLIGIAAIATSLLAIAFFILGGLMVGYSVDLSGKYVLIAGGGLLLISVCFTIGLYLLKNHKSNGRKWVISASFALIAILAVSAFQITNASPGWKLTLLIILIFLVAIIPFIWLINYLWRLRDIE